MRHTATKLIVLLVVAAILTGCAATATIAVGEDLSWWVKRLEPHVSWLGDADDCATFAVPWTQMK